MLKKISLLLLTLIIAIGAFNYATISSLLYSATGLTAKNICSGHFISELTANSIMNEALKPLSKTFNYVDFTVDENNKEVTTSIFGVFERHAIYSNGQGCTLLAPEMSALSHRITRLPAAETIPNIAWPDGSAAAAKNLPPINTTLLNNSLINAFKEPEQTAGRNTKAIVVIHNGQLIAEKYNRDQGINQSTPLLSWSAAKSVTNLQIGLLVKDGKLAIEKPATVPLWKTKSKQHQQITLDQLLRMSSGLEFSEYYSILSDAVFMLSVAPGAAEFAADKPLIYPPNSQWAYSSGTTNIISGIIKRAIGGNQQHYYEYTQKRLFNPLGIYSAELETDSKGVNIGSSYLYMSARDWAKLGQLTLQDGVWNGQRLLPEGWIKYSTTATPNHPKNDYAAQFWLNQDPNIEKMLAQQTEAQKQDPVITNTIKATSRKWPSLPTDIYYMSGFQGQYVVMIPSKNLVVVRLGYTSPGVDSGIETLVAGVIDSLRL